VIDTHEPVMAFVNKLQKLGVPCRALYQELWYDPQAFMC
jgi:hypothetical protein